MVDKYLGYISFQIRPFSYSRKSLECYFYTILDARFHQVGLELLSLWCTIENSTNVSRYRSI